MTDVIYNWNNGTIKQWGENLTHGNFESAQHGHGGVELSPYSQDFTQGYDSVNGRLPQFKRDTVLNYANGNLCDGTYFFPLFVNDVEIDFAIAGTKAQAQKTRDFYPHNMVLPGFQITGQCYDQTSYGMLCEFAHAAQQRQLGSGSPNLMQLYIQGNVYPRNTGTRKPHVSNRAVTLNGNSFYNQTVKGQHQPIICTGYIMSVPRDHKTGDYAPTWSFQFMVKRMISGPYQEGAVTATKQSSWIAILKSKGTPAENFSTNATIAQNKKDMAWVAKNSVNILADPQPGGSSSATAGGSFGTAPPTPTNGYTPTTWATAFLGMLGITASAQAVSNIVHWIGGEGGAGPQFHTPNNTANYNPLNTTEPEPGATDVVGGQGNIKSYTNWAQGLTATVATINNGKYAAILAAIPGPYATFASVVDSSVWGTHDL